MSKKTTIAANNTTVETKATKAAKPAKPAKPAKATPAPVETKEQRQRPGIAMVEKAGGDTATLRIVSQPRMVVGGADTSRAQQCFEMLRKCKTIGEYRAAREKAGLGNTLGGYLPGWIEKGSVALDTPKGKSKSKSKASA